jgi:hypothetical protein
MESNVEKLLGMYFRKKIYSSLDDFLRIQTRGFATIFGENMGDGKVRRFVKIQSPGKEVTYSALYERNGSRYIKIEQEIIFNPQLS